MRKIGLPAGTWRASAATGSAAAASNLYSASTRGVSYLSSSSAKIGSASRSSAATFSPISSREANMSRQKTSPHRRPSEPFEA
jgi:hypothetical protein